MKPSNERKVFQPKRTDRENFSKIRLYSCITGVVFVLSYIKLFISAIELFVVTTTIFLLK